MTCDYSWYEADDETSTRHDFPWDVDPGSIGLTGKSEDYSSGTTNEESDSHPLQSPDKMVLDDNSLDQMCGHFGLRNCTPITHEAESSDILISLASLSLPSFSSMFASLPVNSSFISP